jgi:hypothetical protein
MNRYGMDGWRFVVCFLACLLACPGIVVLCDVLYPSCAYALLLLNLCACMAGLGLGVVFVLIGIWCGGEMGRGARNDGREWTWRG